MVKKDGWKLILYPELKVKLLYNLNQDPQEQKNLSSDATQLPRMRNLFRQLQRLQEKHDDQLDLAAIYPQLSE